MSEKYRAALETSVALSIDNRMDEALVVLDHALDRALGESNKVWIRLLAAYAGTEAEGEGQYVRARDYYELALHSGEDNPWVMYGAALTYAELGDNESAQSWFQRTFDLASTNQDEKLLALLEREGHLPRP